VFDTGGKICYAPGDALNGLTPVDHIRDFHVPIGVYETDVYELELQFGGRSFTARFAVLPDSLATLLAREAGLGWVIGTDLLRHGTVFMDLARRRIAASWRAGECGIA
jgi:hypothetical protein